MELRTIIVEDLIHYYIQVMRLMLDDYTVEMILNIM